MQIHSITKAMHYLKKYKEAIECYYKAIQINPNYADTFNNKGSSLQNLNKYNEAIECYDRVIQLKPNYQPAIEQGAIALNHLKSNLK